MLSSEQVTFMESMAQYYQESLVMALRIEAKRKRNAGYHPLSEALAKIVSWRKRYQAANESERAAFAMWLDWLKHVHVSIDVYTEWSLDYCDKQWMNRQIIRAQTERRAG